MHCVLHGELECIVAIVKSGVDVNVQNKEGETASDFNFLSR